MSYTRERRGHGAQSGMGKTLTTCPDTQASSVARRLPQLQVTPAPLVIVAERNEVEFIDDLRHVDVHAPSKPACRMKGL